MFFYLGILNFKYHANLLEKVNSELHIFRVDVLNFRLGVFLFRFIKKVYANINSELIFLKKVILLS
jgi:hypothetical protein